MEYSVGKKTYLLLIVGVILIFVCCVVAVMVSDRSAPVITINEEKLPAAYSDDMELDELLSGVTAYDDQDGDVTDSLIIEKMIVLSDSQHVKVVYAASDKQHNIAKETILIPYNGSKNFIDVSPEDTSKVQEETTTEEPTTEDVPVVNEPVYVEGGSGTPVFINKEQVNQTGIPQIELKYTDYTIHIGETFSTIEALDMVNATYDDTDMISNRIVISNLQDIDVSKVGDYVLNYSVSDTQGNKSEIRSLTLHVIE